MRNRQHSTDGLWRSAEALARLGERGPQRNQVEKPCPEAFMSRIVLEESPSAIEVERALKSIEEAEYCLCGIPHCKGHEDRGRLRRRRGSRPPSIVCNLTRLLRCEGPHRRIDQCGVKAKRYVVTISCAGTEIGQRVHMCRGSGAGGVRIVVESVCAVENL